MYKRLFLQSSSFYHRRPVRRGHVTMVQPAAGCRAVSTSRLEEVWDTLAGLVIWMTCQKLLGENRNKQLKVDDLISLPAVISLYQSLLPIKRGGIWWIHWFGGSGGIYHCRDAVARVFANSLAATGLLEQSGGLVMCMNHAITLW